MEINHLDLFSGIGGFHKGFEQAGYKVNSYFSEIDKHAVAVYKNKFKNSKYVGSVTNVRAADLPNIDLITFGSPCQDFSLAGKRKGMEGERSSLVLEAIRLVSKCRPNAFIWENVKGAFSSNNGEDFAAILQAFANIGGYRLEWQLLNTSWFLPQNRERIYLVGYSTTPGGNWRGVFPIGESSKIPYTKERNEGQESTSLRNKNSLARTLNARPAFGNGSDDTFIKGACLEVYRKGDGRLLRNDIAPTLTRSGGNSGGNHSDMACLKVRSATKQGYELAIVGDTINLSNPNSKTRRGRVGSQKANTLDTSCDQGVVQTNYNYKKVNETIEQNPKSFKGGKPQMMDLHNRSVKDISPCLVEPHHNGAALFNGYRIRRLTPIECERLQGFPDNHTEYGNYDGEVKKISNTQRYKQCGNAVTVNVVQAIAEKIKPLFNAI